MDRTTTTRACRSAVLERRASFLASQGVSRARIDATGRGENEPVASNDSASGKAQNRRVEVAIFASEEYRKQVTSAIEDLG